MTDLPALVWEGIVTLGSAGVGVLAFSWRLASQVAELKNKLHNAHEKIEKLESDFDTFVREENELWQSLNRTLGQIEGRLDGPTRPPTRSRP